MKHISLLLAVMIMGCIQGPPNPVEPMNNPFVLPSSFYLRSDPNGPWVPYNPQTAGNVAGDGPDADKRVLEFFPPLAPNIFASGLLLQAPVTESFRAIPPPPPKCPPCPVTLQSQLAEASTFLDGVKVARIVFPSQQLPPDFAQKYAAVFGLTTAQCFIAFYNEALLTFKKVGETEVYVKRTDPFDYPKCSLLVSGDLKTLLVDDYLYTPLSVSVFGLGNGQNSTLFTSEKLDSLPPFVYYLNNAGVWQQSLLQGGVGSFLGYNVNGVAGWQGGNYVGLPNSRHVLYPQPLLNQTFMLTPPAICRDCPLDYSSLCGEFVPGSSTYQMPWGRNSVLPITFNQEFFDKMGVPTFLALYDGQAPGKTLHYFVRTTGDLPDIVPYFDKEGWPAPPPILCFNPQARASTEGYNLYQQTLAVQQLNIKKPLKVNLKVPKLVQNAFSASGTTTTSKGTAITYKK